MKRIALVVGNDNYDDHNQNLKCAVNDADALSHQLEELHFDVRLLKNIGQYELAAELTSFTRDLSRYDVGLFYFAGHGFQVRGENFIACRDTQFADEISISHTGYKLEDIINDLDSSNLKIKILIIDACRKTINGVRGGVNSFAPITAPKGTIIAFATSPGQSAKEDDKSGHGYYTKALLKHLKAKNLSIEEMFKRVRNTVYMDTSGGQITWEHTSLLGDFCFNDFAEISSEMKYSNIALADGDYEPVQYGMCFDIIKKALTHDYNHQNTIPRMLYNGRSQMSGEQPDDIFVLGRNLYQSSYMAYSVQDYFEDLHNKLLSYPQDFAEHLLNGMAYEIFFDREGKLRCVFKTHDAYKKVLAELELERFEKCKDFIYSSLKGFSQAVIYIPDNKLEMKAYLKENSEWICDDSTYYRINAIEIDGINVMYNSKGTELYSMEEDYYLSCDPVSQNDCTNNLISRVAGMKRGVEVLFYLGGEIAPNDAKILWSNNFRLIKYID